MIKITNGKETIELDDNLSPLNNDAFEQIKEYISKNKRLVVKNTSKKEKKESAKKSTKKTAKKSENKGKKPTKSKSGKQLNLF